MFDPSLPHLKPILTIKFPPFVNIHPVDISVFSPLRLLAVTRVDGTVQLMSMITPASRIMASAIDPLNPVRPPPFETFLTGVFGALLSFR